MTGFFITFRIALRNLLQHRRRTLFLGLALAAVTGCSSCSTGWPPASASTLLHTATTLTSGHLNVGGFFKVSGGTSAPVVTRYAEVLETVRKAVPEMRFAVQRGRGWAKVISDRGSMQAGIGGIDIRNEPEFKNVLTITSGNIEDLAQPNTILVFEGQLEKLDVKVGDAITISAQTTRGIANTIDCRVAAIAKDVGLLSKWNVYVPNETLQSLYQLRSDATGAIPRGILKGKRHPLEDVGQVEYRGFEEIRDEAAGFIYDLFRIYDLLGLAALTAGLRRIHFGITQFNATVAPDARAPLPGHQGQFGPSYILPSIDFDELAEAVAALAARRSVGIQDAFDRPCLSSSIACRLAPGSNCFDQS